MYPAWLPYRYHDLIEKNFEHLTNVTISKMKSKNGADVSAETFFLSWEGGDHDILQTLLPAQENLHISRVITGLWAHFLNHSHLRTILIWP